VGLCFLWTYAKIFKCRDFRNTNTWKRAQHCDTLPYYVQELRPFKIVRFWPNLWNVVSLPTVANNHRKWSSDDWNRTSVKTFCRVVSYSCLSMFPFSLFAMAIVTEQGLNVARWTVWEIDMPACQWTWRCLATVDSIAMPAAHPACLHTLFTSGVPSPWYRSTISHCSSISTSFL